MTALPLSTMISGRKNSYEGSLKHKPSESFLGDNEMLEKEPLVWSERRRPRSQRLFRIIAYTGWALSILLLLLLGLSHSTLAPKSLPRLDLGRFELNLGRGSTKAHPVTIVSGFYLVDGGKKHSIDGEYSVLSLSSRLFTHSHAEYHDWLSNFLSSVELPIIFYCAPSLVDWVQELRGDKVRLLLEINPLNTC